MTSQRDPTFWGYIPPPQYLRANLIANCPTLPHLLARRHLLARVAAAGNLTTLANRLSDATPSPLKIGCDPLNIDRHRTFFVGRGLEILKYRQGTPGGLQFIDDDYVFPTYGDPYNEVNFGKLNTIDITNIKAVLRDRLRRDIWIKTNKWHKGAGYRQDGTPRQTRWQHFHLRPGTVVLGMLQINPNYDTNRWQPHFHLVTINLVERELKALARKYYPAYASKIIPVHDLPKLLNYFGDLFPKWRLPRPRGERRPSARPARRPELREWMEFMADKSLPSFIFTFNCDFRGNTIPEGLYLPKPPSIIIKI